MIILIVGEVAHKIALWVSPGGKEFVAIQLFVKYWIWFLSFGGGLVTMSGIIIWIVKYKKKKKGVVSNEKNETK